MSLAMAASSIKYEFESVLYDIPPENPPTNPSPSPCLIIQLRYTHRWLLKFQSDDDDEDENEKFIKSITPEFSFLFCIPVDRLTEGGYISHVLERDYSVHLQPCECDYLEAQISAFAPTLLLAKSDTKHQVIQMAVVLQVTKVECIHDCDEFAESDKKHDENEEFTTDNFRFFVSL